MFYPMLLSCPACGLRGGVGRCTVSFQRSSKSSKPIFKLPLCLTHKTMKGSLLEPAFLVFMLMEDGGAVDIS
jgi:hypothetical protein